MISAGSKFYIGTKIGKSTGLAPSIVGLQARLCPLDDPSVSQTFVKNPMTRQGSWKNQFSMNSLSIQRSPCEKVVEDPTWKVLERLAEV